METPEDFEAAVKKQLKYWQQVLRLQDWNIELRIVRQHELGDPDALAECEYYLERKDAFIRIVPPIDLDKFDSSYLEEEARDYDVTIIHELLHLHFALFDDPQYECAHEQVINTLSRAFAKIYRLPSTEPGTISTEGSHGHYV